MPSNHFVIAAGASAVAALLCGAPAWAQGCVQSAYINCPNSELPSFDFLNLNNSDLTMTNFGRVDGDMTGTNAPSGSGSYATTLTNYGNVGGEISLINVSNGAATIMNRGTANWLFMEDFSNSPALAINSGVVSSGVLVLSEADATVVNSGFIGEGMELDSHNSRLIVLPGSVIVGSIGLFGAFSNAVTMNVGNQDLTLHNFAPTIVTGDVPFVVAGHRIASIDPTGFAIQGLALGDFARAVSSAIPDLPAAAPYGGLPLAFAEPQPSRLSDAFAAIPGLAAAASDPSLINATASYANGGTMWARGFAAARNQPGDGGMVGASDQVYGGMIGGSFRLRPDLAAGAFFGVGASRTAIDFNLGGGRSDLVFGGGYVQYDAGATFVRATLQGGGSRNSSTRNVNNNTVAGGLETASASYGGWYVSPEATLGRRIALGDVGGASYTLTPSLGLRYVYGDFDGYTETGVAAPLTIGRRSVGGFEERGELDLTRAVTMKPDSALSTTFYGGALANQQTGGDVNAALLGQSISFSANGKTDPWGGFGGAKVEWRAGAATLFAAVEGQALSDRSTVVGGRAGVSLSF